MSVVQIHLSPPHLRPRKRLGPPKPALMAGKRFVSQGVSAFHRRPRFPWYFPRYFSKSWFPPEKMPLAQWGARPESAAQVTPHTRCSPHSQSKHSLAPAMQTGFSNPDEFATVACTAAKSSPIETLRPQGHPLRRKLAPWHLLTRSLKQ